MRKFAAIAAISAAAAVGAVAVAGSAGAESDAASITGVIKRTTTSYTSPSTVSSPVHFNLAANTRTNVLCYTEGQTQNGNPYWIRIGQDGKTGFVHRDSIVPAETPPHC